jgi:hypothetical protein
MRLVNRRETPSGGFTYTDPLTTRFFSTDSTFDSLVKKVSDYQSAQGIETPSNLALLIEDQICMRQPPGKCRYSKLAGDQVSRVIHKAASVVDKLLGTTLEKKARGCGGCGRRRQKLNSISLTRNAQKNT